MIDATAFLRSGKYSSAAELFQSTLTNAIANKDERLAARARIGLSVCFMATHEFKASTENAERAYNYGVREKDAEIAVRAGLNLSSVYRRMGNFNAASQTLRTVHPFVHGINDEALKARVYLHSGIEASRRRDWARAEPLFVSAIDSALAQNDVASAALGWNLIGYMRMLSGELAKADTALTESFRLRRSMGNRDLGTSYLYLGMLRIAQGDPRSALNLLNRAIQLGWNGEAPERLSAMYHNRGKAKRALSDLPGALADFEEAVRRAALWREEILPSDDDRVSFEAGVDRRYDDYVFTGMALWQKTRDPALSRRMFETAEEHKSASFRRTLAAGQRLPAEYYGALASYRSALASAWRSGKAEPASAARVKLSQVEAKLGLKTASAQRRPLPEVQRTLGSSEALISFSIGEAESWMWAVTRHSFEAFRLPGRAAIAPVAERYRASVETGGPPAGSDTELYATLFGQLGSDVQSKKDWLLSLDDGLYSIPFAALGSEKTPLILFHSVRSIFGAGLVTGKIPAVLNSRFMGAGDAIYNSADPRWTGPRLPNTTEFARLVNTGYEVKAVAAAWKHDPRPELLFGDRFKREHLDRLLRSEAAVCHIAGHVVQHETDKNEVMIGLGLGSDGRPDFLTPADIASKSLRVGLVTVNGCASGTGAELPGAGLVGLTRAWLVGGAHAVAATYWPLPDDRGDLFVRMYTEIAAQRPGVTAAKAARALREAQVAAWRSGAKPRHWAAVFLSSKN
ncbi:MAG TPA: CHAT domain-containing tetratricopeptide repeat protein [Bryobacteraceae bacterium]|nr:CHAT domain-containing tetratricopeptide repeat protein [Bryobacteraceae bacterium]